MNTLPSSAATIRRGWKTCSEPASAVPTSTGATATGSVRGRAAVTHSRSGLRARRGCGSRTLWELGEIGLALLDVGVARRLQHPQRERRLGEHLAAPLDGLELEPLERHDRVHEAHLVGPLGVVLAAEEPDLTRELLADLACEQPGAVAAVEGADLRAGLPEAR